MRNTKSKIIIVMCIAICFMVIGYATFSTSLSITGTSNITSTWKVEFTKIEEVSKTSGVTIINSPTATGTSATFLVGLAMPGDKIVYQITIENKGTIDAKVQNIVASATDSPAIIFNMTGIQIGEEIKSKATKTIEVTIEYNPSVTTQPEKVDKLLTVDITVVQSTGASANPSNPSVTQPLYLSSAIFRDNTAYADNTSSQYVTTSTGINFSAISSDTNGKGLYYTSTNTEGNQPTYYFRGAVTNNFVKFGENSSGSNLYWRIIRINEDGSIRLIYNGTSTAATGSSTHIGTNNFNSISSDNAYEGYMYGLPESTTIYGDINDDGTLSILDTLQLNKIVAKSSIPTKKQELMADLNFDGKINSDDASLLLKMVNNSEAYNLSNYSQSERYNKTHANATDSTIKAVLDTWYANNLIGYSSYLADAGVCNDRSAYSGTAIGTTNTNYASYNRLMSLKKPQFKCQSAEKDLFTLNESTKGNKALKYPIGLITADEVAYAGGVFGVQNSTYYIGNGIGLLTMTPRNFSSSAARVWNVDKNGGISDVAVNNTYGAGIRPVINLKSTVEITGGDGTSTNPYVIKTN